MSGKYKERYGFPGEIVSNLYDCWFKKRLKESDFASFDAFLKWCSENEYQFHAQLRRYDESKPYGPDNAFWYVRGAYQPVPKKEYVSPFCENCQEQSAVCINGCQAWKEWFVKNWNANIHIKPKAVPQEPPMQEYFRYEPPDLVREGL